MGGGNETVGRKRPRSAPDITHQPEVAPAPGKSTGIGLVDEGPLCKQTPDKPGCFLDADSRQYLIQSLGFVVQTAMTNFQTALQNQRVRLLTTVQKNSSTWGFVAEFLFQSLSGGLIGMLSKSLDGLKARATEVLAKGGTMTVYGQTLSDAAAKRLTKFHPKHITGVAVQASKGLRTTLKNAAHSNSGTTVASATDVDKADFLTLIQNGIGPMANNLFTEAPTSMTDAELAAMVAAYEDMTYHSVDAYEADLVTLLDAYDDQQIASIGDGLCNGIDEHNKRQMLSVRHAVWVTAGPRSRLAIIEVFDPIYAKTSPTKGDNDGKPVPWEQSLFVSWVGNDLTGVAQDYETTRSGAVALLNATKADTGMPEIDTWAKESP